MQRSALCRSRRELSNAYLLAKFSFDTAENEPSQVCPIEQYAPLHEQLAFLARQRTGVRRREPRLSVEFRFKISLNPEIPANFRRIKHGVFFKSSTESSEKCPQIFENNGLAHLLKNCEESEAATVEEDDTAAAEAEAAAKAKAEWERRRAAMWAPVVRTHE